MFRRNLIFSVIFLLLGICINVIGQTSELSEADLKRLAEDYFISGYFGSAQEMYEKLDRMSPNNMEYLYNLAVCYTKTNQHKDKAVQILEDIKAGKVPKSKFKLNLGELEYYLGKSYHLEHRFDEAIKAYNNSLTFKKVDFDLMDDAKLSATMCENAKDIVANPIEVTIKNLGKPINSEYDEHSAIVSADEEYMVFTTKRSGNVGGKMDVHGYPDENGIYFEDIYIARRNNDIWRLPYNIIDTINTEAQEATTGLSADGQTLLLYISSFGKYGDVYQSKKIGDKWTVPQPLPKPINTHNFMEAHACLSGTEKEIFFTSDRSDGFGGKDIYVCKKQPDGSWGEAINLGPDINTEFDEEGPYIHADGRTLFFSSKGHKSMGGFDIFKTVYDDNKWSEPENIGYPLNTAGDDIFFVLSADGTKGYFTSRREGGLGGSDIYTVEVDYSFGKEPVVVVLKGVVNELGQSVDAYIVVTDIDKNLVVGEYNSNQMSGDYLLALPPGANYDVHFASKDGSLDKHVAVYLKDVKQYTQIKHDVDLKEDVDKPNKMEKLTTDPKTGEIIVEKSQPQMQRLQEMLKDNPNLKLEVAVVTDTTNKNKLNLATALGRSIKLDMEKRGVDSNQVVPKAMYSGNPLIDREVQVKVLQGSVADQIVVKNNQVYVKKNNIADELSGNESKEDKFIDELIKEIESTPSANNEPPVMEEEPELKEELPLAETKKGKKPEPTPTATTNLKHGYKVQIAAFSNAIPIEHPFFKGTQNIMVKKWPDGLTRYTLGTFNTIEEADAYRNQLKSKFYDAFVVKF